jgi:hypothetical protein
MRENSEENMNQSGGGELPILVAQKGPLEGQRWLVEEALTIGRDPACDLIINDRQVSRFHARLQKTEQGVLLEDLGSKNGTYWNGERVSDPVILQDGDLILIAMIQHFAFLNSDATMPLEGGFLLGEKPAEGLRVEARSRRVWVNGKEIHPPLSAQQFRLLQALERRRGQVVSRQELIEEVWGEKEAAGVTEQAFDALVRRLRDRLADADPEHAYVITVRGHGLRLENTP